MFAPKLARWFANEFAIAAAVYAASGVASAQQPGNFPAASGQHQASVRAMDGQRPRRVRAVGGICLTQRRLMSTPWLARRFANDLAIPVGSSWQHQRHQYQPNWLPLLLTVVVVGLVMLFFSEEIHCYYGG